VTDTIIEPMEARVPMSDGVVLAGDLYLPPGDGPFATVVRKTPYERRLRPELDLHLARSGFAVLVANQRGRYDSEGSFYQFRNESVDHTDGRDTIEWAAAQPWSDGNVGTYGTSSDGQWQLAAATTRPPHLRAMVVSYPANPRTARVDHGAFLGTMPAWASMFGLARPLTNRKEWEAWLEDWRRRELPLVASFIHPEVLDGLAHVDYDEYWEETDPANRYDQVEVPILHECGWYDRYVGPTFRNFNAIRTRGATDLARSAQHVLVGPWSHGGGIPSVPGRVEFGPAATIDRMDVHLRWFDHWLRGADNDIAYLPAVQVYVQGSERWLSSDMWPLADTRTKRWYLAAGSGEPRESLNDGRLDDRAPGDDEPDAYDHDPYDPVPSIGGHGGVGWQWPAGPIDQRPAESRSLTFTTDPLEESLTVIGEPRVRFFASTSAADTDFVVTLSDVHRDGYSAILRQNAIRARYRSGERAKPIEPGEVYEYDLTLDGVAVTFLAGHRIRVRISSSSFPAYLPNPGTAEPLHLVTKAILARNAVFHDGARPSFIELPVVAMPAGSERGGLADTP
jgi:uncharacterized protein